TFYWPAQRNARQPCNTGSTRRGRDRAGRQIGRQRLERERWAHGAEREIARPVLVAPDDDARSGRSHSANFDHRRRPETLRTAMAMAFFCPTNTTSCLPLVTPV